VASGTFVSESGIEIVTSGSTTIATSVGFLGLELVSSGGTANGTIVSSDIGRGQDQRDDDARGTLAIASGYVLSGFVVSYSVFLEVSAGGLASAAQISGAEHVESGGSSRGAMILTGGVQAVSGSAISATVKGDQFVWEGVALGAKVQSGGVQRVNGGIAISTTLSSAGAQLVESGGTATSTTVSAGAGEEVFGPSVASATIVRGGYLQVGSGGSAFDSIITSKGLMVIGTSAGAANAIVGSGGTMRVAGEATDAIISGGYQQVDDGGAAKGSVITKNGLAFVEAGGSGDNMTVGSGGTMKLAGVAKIPSSAARARSCRRLQYQRDNRVRQRCRRAGDRRHDHAKGADQKPGQGRLYRSRQCPLRFRHCGRCWRHRAEDRREGPRHKGPLLILQWSIEARRPVLFQ
jgi:autotransporter passenger strand-loop-strand repeat protein